MKTTFLESQDTVRYVRDQRGQLTPGAEDSLRQSELDWMFSVLFGHIPLVSEPISFDSHGFTKIAQQIAKAHAKVRRTVSLEKPFEVALAPREKQLSIDKETFRRVVALRFKNPQFILSGFPRIQEDANLRASIAEDILAGHWRDAQKELYGQAPADLEALQHLEVIDGLVSAHPRQYFQKHSAMPQVGLPARCTFIINKAKMPLLDQAVLDNERLLEVAARGGVTPEQLSKFVHNVQLTIREFRALYNADSNYRQERRRSAIFMFAKRSYIRDYLSSAHASNVDPQVKCAVQEFIDTSYNLVVARSIAPAECRFSGLGADGAMLDGGAIGNQLAITVDTLLSRPSSQRRTPRVIRGGTCGVANQIITVSHTSPRVPWENVLSITANPRFARTLGNLRQAWSRQDPSRSEDALKAHCDFLANELGKDPNFVLPKLNQRWETLCEVVPVKIKVLGAASLTHAVLHWFGLPNELCYPIDLLVGYAAHKPFHHFLKRDRQKRESQQRIKQIRGVLMNLQH